MVLDPSTGSQLPQAGGPGQATATTPGSSVSLGVAQTQDGGVGANEHPELGSAELGGTQLLSDTIGASSRKESSGYGGAEIGNPFDFDWQASFESLSAATNTYEPQGELVDEIQFHQSSRQEFVIPAAAYPEGLGDPNNPFPTVIPPQSTPLPPEPTYPVVAPQQTLTPSGLKRKAESEPSVGAETWTASSTSEKVQPTVPPRKSSKQTLSSTFGRGSGMLEEHNSGGQGERQDPLVGDSTQHRRTPTSRSRSDQVLPATTPRQTFQDAADKNASSVSGGVGRKEVHANSLHMLPREKVFPIQIGPELFRLSGASISSDAPSYFSQFFGRQLQENGNDAGGIRTLYIDRDPNTFRDISNHLQGYHVAPRDSSHFVKLFADAQLYSLPRLISQLFESEIFIQIGHRNFQIPRDIFSSPGDSPNFFSLGFAIFFSTPEDTFPGLRREGLLRPPSILPPSVPNRSGDVFAQLLHLLRGYPLHIENEEHRAALLRDCRYYQFKGIEQKLIPHQINYNLKRSRTETVIRLEDIRQSGVSFAPETSPADRSSSVGWVNYSRPFVDETSYELVLEIGGESTKINFQTMRADFHGQIKARVASLFQVVANKMNLPNVQPLGLLMMSGGAASQSASPGHTPLSDDQVRIRIDRDAHVVLDGEDYWLTRSRRGQIDEDFSEENSTLTAIATGNSTPVVSATESSFPSGMSQAEGSSASQSHSVPKVSTGYAQLPLAAQRRSPATQSPLRRKRRGSFDDFGEWVVRTGQWRLKVQSSQDTNRGGMEVVLVAVKLDASSGEKDRNAHRPFLTR